jgi:parallel beta-helix repeat protein
MKNKGICIVFGVIMLLCIASIAASVTTKSSTKIKIDDKQELDLNHRYTITDNENTKNKCPSSKHSQYNPHEPIYIHGNDEFTEENGVTSGEGTEDNPYIIEGWDINAASEDGIVILNVSRFFIIRNCYIHDGGIEKDGIAFYNVTNGAIKHNIITRNRNGIVFRHQHPGKESSDNNVISHNSITLNTKQGICFQHLGKGWHCNNVITHNDISSNSGGIYMITSAENQILYNNITSNNGYGILLERCKGGGEYNLIHHNNFIDNMGEEGQVCERGTPLNYWNDSYPSGGNYWSDYTGEDEFQGPNQDIPGSDGIGDTPYDIPRGNNKDMYPLMKPWTQQNSPPFKPVIIGPTFGEAGKEYEYIFFSIDLDNDDVYYYIKWGDQTVEEWIGPYASGVEVTIPHTWKEKGTYIISVKAKDTHDAESDWGTLQIWMPKNTHLLKKILEHFPIIERIITISLMLS